MDVIEAIQTRKSIRGYKPDPIPKQIIEEILANAVKAPSAMNSQPWLINVVTGKELDEVKKQVMEAVKAGTKFSPDIPHKPYEGVFRERAKVLAAQLYGLLNIPWEDKGKRAEWLNKGFRYFDAPVAIIISKDKSVDESQAIFALGTLTQNICLSALNYGLGTCIADMGIGFPSVLRKCLGISESLDILMCVSIGYPDWNFPANKVKTSREPIQSVLTWHGF